MKPFRIIGLGSPFGDDQAGWITVASLKGKVDEESFSLLTCNTPARLIPLMEGATRVCLVDAVKSGAPPGTLHRLEGEALKGFKTGLSSHALGLQDALALGKALGITPPMVFFGIEASSSMGNLSPPVAQALPGLVESIVRLTASW